MRHLFRPRSRSFRAVLSMALLAWAMLASGALATPLTGFGAMGTDAAAVMTHSQSSGAHCDDMPTRDATSDHAPSDPMGQWDCCHGGCHCLSTCSTALAVPRLAVAAQHPAHALLPMFASAAPLTAPAAPPLRPPIT